MKIIEVTQISPPPARERRANKGSCGSLLIVAGSVNMAGAAYFAGLSAYRMGTGIVRICTPAQNRVILQTMLPEAVLITDDEITDAVKRSDAVVIGPGLGQSDDALRRLTTVMDHLNKPLLMDADALNLVAYRKINIKDLPFPCVITPHPGEMSRLTGISVEEILRDPPKVCMEYANEKHLICLLKDAETVISDGKTVYRNHSGCPALATAGSGDCLAGMIGALLADHMDPITAACTGAYLHGKCGEIARERIGERPTMARDISEAIPKAIQASKGETICN